MKSITNILEQLEKNIIKTTATKPIADAVKNRKKISFYYRGPSRGKDSVKAGQRIDAEGVAIGLTKRGNIALRAYVQPPSVSKKGFGKTGWRTFLLNRMKNVQVSDETFDVKRPDYQEGDDGSFTVTYVTSDWTKTKKVKPEVKPEPTAEPTPTEPVEPTAVEPTTEPAEPTTTEPTPTEPTTVEPTATEPAPAPPQTQTVPTATELPQPKPRTKPSKTPPTSLTPAIPEPQAQEKPSATPPTEVEPENPEEENPENLSEALRRIKRLMYS